MAHPSYTAIVRDSERATWSLAQATSGLVELDFEKPFFPEELVHAQRLPFLGERDAILLSQIRAHSYLGLNVLVEKLTVPFVMSQAAGSLNEDTERLLALIGHGHRAVKHIALFERFSASLRRGFDVPCGAVEHIEDITARLLAHDTLSIGLFVLHFECVAQTHYVRLALGSKKMDPQFKKLLRLHWQEESHHVELVSLELSQLADESPHHGRGRAVVGYLRMLDEVSAALREQLELDLATFERVARPLDDAERRQWRSEQEWSYQEVFLHHGLVHPGVQGMLGAHFGGGGTELHQALRTFRGSTRAADTEGR